MRTVFTIVFLAVSVSALAAETQVKQQDIKGDCNVALGINQGKVEVKCGLQEAALKPLADKLNAIQKEQKLLDKEVESLVSGVNLLMSAVVSGQEKIIAEIRQGNKERTEEVKNVERVVAQQVERVLQQLPTQGGEAIARFKQDAQEYRKKYEDLLAQWNTVQGDEQGKLAIQALQAGDVDRAGKILDEILAAQDKVAEKTAANHFRRGGIFELQFKPHEALQQYDAAYRGAPKNFQYSHAYAVLLQRQNEFRKAARVYEDNLEALRELAQKNPEAYEPNLAAVLNNLGALYGATQRFAEAAKAYGEALALYLKYAERSPEVFEKDVRRVERLVAELKGDAPKPAATESTQTTPRQ